MANGDPIWSPLNIFFELFEVSGPGWVPGRPWAGSKAPNCAKVKSPKWILCDSGEDFDDNYGVFI